MWWLIPLIAVAVVWFLTKSIPVALVAGVIALAISIGLLGVDINFSALLKVFS